MGAVKVGAVGQVALRRTMRNSTRLRRHFPHRARKPARKRLVNGPSPMFVAGATNRTLEGHLVTIPNGELASPDANRKGNGFCAVRGCLRRCGKSRCFPHPAKSAIARATFTRARRAPFFLTLVCDKKSSRGTHLAFRCGANVKMKGQTPAAFMVALAKSQRAPTMPGISSRGTCGSCCANFFP